MPIQAKSPKEIIQEIYQHTDIPEYNEPWLRSLLASAIVWAAEQAAVHNDHEGGYCDTGEDMDWACRSECAENAVNNLRSLAAKITEE